jgi:hypothetical protein
MGNTSEQMPGIILTFNDTLGAAKTTFRMIIVVLGIFALCALVWLMRTMPRRRRAV